MVKLKSPIVLFLVFIAIALYGYVRCEWKLFDPLSVKLGIWDLDGWSASHFICFAIIGYFFPDEIHIAFFLGIGWEVFEHALGESRPTWLGGWAACKTDNDINNWWYGRLSDIFMNTAGLAFGYYLRKYIR